MSATELPAEFSIIARHFRPLAGPGALDLLDDAAVFAPAPGQDLVAAADAMVAGVHFLPDDPPGLVGKKLLRVNLSDIAAMGATPFGYLMTVSAPKGTADSWFADFAAGLAEDQDRFGVYLLGGDTTSTPGPVTLSLTILGTVARGRAIRRSGARAGHSIWVTGTIGDAALGLAVLQGRLDDPTGFLAARYRLPEPRLEFVLGGTQSSLPGGGGQGSGGGAAGIVAGGLTRQSRDARVKPGHDGIEEDREDRKSRLSGIVSAGMDISDGLVQDLGHLCRSGGVRAEIDAEAVPLSAAARSAGPDWLATCLTGGDDYELLLVVLRDREAALRAVAQEAGVPVTRIGRFVAGKPEVVVRGADGAPLMLERAGWSHF